MNFNITMSDLRNVPEEVICGVCQNAFVFEEDKGKEDGRKYTTEELQTLFDQPSEQEPATSESEEVYLLLSSIYFGGGSLVKLKSTVEKYKQENFYLHQAEKTMKNMMVDE